jgi:mono/diheme cytochrome c family protein
MALLLALLAIATAVGFGFAAGTGSSLPAVGGDAAIRGQRLFVANCAICHGVEGDGRGMAAHMLREQPRDFRPGIFKFRSTPTGALPMEADLLRTLADGVRWTGMVGRPDLPEADRRALVAYLVTLSPRFAAATPQPPVAIPPRPATTPSLLRDGKAVYEDAGCGECHGLNGRGDGPAARSRRDAWGNPTRPSNLTWRPLKRGADPADLYRTILTGLDGTPMPAFADALDARQAWALVAYLETLVPPDHRVPATAVLGEERAGWMILRMHGGGMHRRARLPAL